MIYLIDVKCINIKNITNELDEIEKYRTKAFIQTNIIAFLVITEGEFGKEEGIKLIKKHAPMIIRSIRIYKKVGEKLYIKNLSKYVYDTTHKYFDYDDWLTAQEE
jgi:hypothetical protein